LAEAYSARTLLQSHSSSSATIIGRDVYTPCPISDCERRMVTLPSGAIRSQALSTAAPAASAVVPRIIDGTWNPRVRPAVVAAAVLMKPRRLRLVCCMTDPPYACAARWIAFRIRS
jgi:hypothetical protein